MFRVLYPEVTARILWKQLGMTGGLPKDFLHQSMGRKREALARSLWCVSHPQMWQGHYIWVMLLQTPFKTLLSDGKNHKYSVYVHFYMMEFWMIDLFLVLWSNLNLWGPIFMGYWYFTVSWVNKLVDSFLWITNNIKKKIIIWWGCKFIKLSHQECWWFHRILKIKNWKEYGIDFSGFEMYMYYSDFF